MSLPAVQVEQLYFRHQHRQILNGVDLQVQKGSIVAIMGPSGCGKTTLLRLISAQLYPQSGRVLVDSHNIHQLSRHQLFSLRQKMGMLFQSAALFTNLSVFENVAFGLRAHGDYSQNEIEERVLSKLHAVGLEQAHTLMPAELSGGMSRRVALARAIAMEPKIMMYDEPFAGQDPITLGVLVRLIKELNKKMLMTTILVSHDVPETLSIADYVYVLAQGQVIGHGTPEELNKADNPEVQQFLQGLPDGAVPFHYQAHRGERYAS